MNSLNNEFLEQLLKIAMHLEIVNRTLITWKLWVHLLHLQQVPFCYAQPLRLWCIWVCVSCRIIVYFSSELPNTTLIANFNISVWWIIWIEQSKQLSGWYILMIFIYTLSHLENDRDVNAYSGGRRLSSRAQLVFSHAIIKEHRDASCSVYSWTRSVTSRSFHTFGLWK